MDTSNFLKLRFIGPVGTFIGGAIGGVVGGPAGAMTGAKIGFGTGSQVAILSKVDTVAGTAGKKLDDASERLIQIVEKAAGTWGTFMLIGYAAKIAISCSTTSYGNYKTSCSGMTESLPCAMMVLASSSFSAAAAALAWNLYKAAKKIID